MPLSSLRNGAGGNDRKPASFMRTLLPIEETMTARLRDLLDKSPLTLQALSEKVEMTPKRVEGKLSGEKVLTVTDIFRFADALGMERGKVHTLFDA